MANYDIPSTIAPSIPPLRPGRNIPSFFQIFQGLWLLTWNSQMALRRLPMLLVQVLLVPIVVYSAVGQGGDIAFNTTTARFYLLLLVPMFCLYQCGSLIRDELQADTLGFFLTRPLTRARFLAARYACQVLWLQVIVAINGLLLYAVGYLRGVEGIHQTAWVLLTAQIFAVFAYGSLATLLGLISKRYLVLGLIYGFVVEIGIGRIPTNINLVSLSRHLQILMANSPVMAEQFEWTAKGSQVSMAILVVAALLFLSLATVLFTLREYHSTEEMQK